MNNNELKMLRDEFVRHRINDALRIRINDHSQKTLSIFPSDFIEMIDATLTIRQQDTEYDRGSYW